MRAAISLLAIPVVAGLLLAGPAAPAAAQQDPGPLVTVVGDGRVLVQPDVAQVGFGVEATGTLLDATQADVSTRTQAVIDTLLARGVAREDIRTARLGVNPVYDQRDNTRLQGYRVTNSVQVRLRDLEQVGPIIDAATAAGANRVDGIAFQVSDPAPYQDQARAAAMANARAKADQLAALSNLRVVAVSSIVEAGATPPQPRAVTARAEAAPAAAPAPPVEPGQQEIRTQLTVTFVMG
jgi:uncharacterized protein